MHNEHDHDESGASINWPALMAGAFIGAGVALLFAPQKGTELRSQLRDYANRASDDLLEKGQESWEIAVERGKEYYDKGEEMVQEAGRAAQQFAEQGAQQGQKAVKQAGRAVKDVAQQTPDVARDLGRSAL